ncbi:hypothetical protein N7486_008395 [Penicillium sp. IBT 16267x]|nr:hypothetical protein N7486_008395 [Penicillium sp. IBT 16267x]
MEELALSQIGTEDLRDIEKLQKVARMVQASMISSHFVAIRLNRLPQEMDESAIADIHHVRAVVTLEFTQGHKHTHGEDIVHYLRPLNDVDSHVCPIVWLLAVRMRRRRSNAARRRKERAAAEKARKKAGKQATKTSSGSDSRILVRNQATLPV